jgi:hypothetical protein
VGPDDQQRVERLEPGAGPGDVIECTGFGAGWGSDPGFGVEWTTERSRADGAGYLELHPSVGGAFAYHPAPGLLRRIEEEP